MKTLEPVNLARLSNLEFGQHVKSARDGIIQLGGIVSDASFVSYLNLLGNASANYDLAMVQVFKSDETAKIAEADKVRDAAVSALKRMVSVYELSDDANERLAFESLNTLFAAYGDIQVANFEAETNSIQNLIVDLEDIHYEPHVTLLNLSGYITRLQSANVAFITLFAGRTQETASKPVYDVKQLRDDMKNIYTDMAGYVLSMSKAKDTDEFNQSLHVINTIRTYYAKLLAKRMPKNGDPETPIPPIE